MGHRSNQVVKHQDQAEDGIYGSPITAMGPTWTETSTCNGTTVNVSRITTLDHHERLPWKLELSQSSLGTADGWRREEFKLVVSADSRRAFMAAVAALPADLQRIVLPIEAMERPAGARDVSRPDAERVRGGDA